MYITDLPFNLYFITNLDILSFNDLSAMLSIAFSKYIFYSVGGAEKSIVEILKKRASEKIEITLIGVDNLKSFNSSKYENINLFNWNKIALPLSFQIKKFVYFEYFFSLNHILLNNYFPMKHVHSTGIYKLSCFLRIYLYCCSFIKR